MAEHGTARRAVSLFSGAGGLDLGVERARYSVIYAVENDPTAVATLNRNRERWYPELGKVSPLDITTLDPEDVLDTLGAKPGEIDLLVGGPPCVAFSKSGFHLEYKRDGRDPKGGPPRCYYESSTNLKALQPRAFLMENVFGLAYRNQSRAFYDALCHGKSLGLCGYSLTKRVSRTPRDYGVPQNPATPLPDREPGWLDA